MTNFNVKSPFVEGLIYIIGAAGGFLTINAAIDFMYSNNIN